VHATDILGKPFHLKQGKIRSDFIGGTLCLSDDLIDMEGFAGEEREESGFVFRKRRERPFKTEGRDAPPVLLGGVYSPQSVLSAVTL
jgi:hypothetical protein